MIFDGNGQYFHSSQNSKIVMSLQISKKKLDEVDFFGLR